MNAVYFIVIIFFNSITGDIDHKDVSAKPVPLQECLQALTDRGPIKVTEDNLAQVGICVRADTVNGHVDT